MTNIEVEMGDIIEAYYEGTGRLVPYGRGSAIMISAEEIQELCNNMMTDKTSFERHPYKRQTLIYDTGV